MRQKLILAALVLSLVLTACKKQDLPPQTMSKDTEASVPPQWEDLYEEIAPIDIPDNIIQLISNDWMLVTAGNRNHFNTMTASWGAMGELWGKDAAFIFIRESRYTFGFLQEYSCFTLSFFPVENREALKICGTRSGRDTDKVKEAGLEVIPSPTGNISFGQARMIVECRKMFVQKMDRGNLIPEYASSINPRYYTPEDPADHYMFVGEILKVWVKKDF